MLQICIACTTAFSSGAETCPNCGSPDWIDEGAEFPIVGETGPEDLPGDLPLSVRAQVDGGEIVPVKAKPTKGS